MTNRIKACLYGSLGWPFILVSVFFTQGWTQSILGVVSILQIYLFSVTMKAFKYTSVVWKIEDPENFVKLPVRFIPASMWHLYFNILRWLYGYKFYSAGVDGTDDFAVVMCKSSQLKQKFIYASKIFPGVFVSANNKEIKEVEG